MPRNKIVKYIEPKKLNDQKQGEQEEKVAEKSDKENSKVGAVLKVANKIESAPYRNSYVSKNNRSNLYNFDDDPVKAKLQALLRKTALQSNKKIEDFIQGTNWKSGKSEVYSKEDVNKLTNTGFNYEDASEILNLLRNVDRKTFHENKIMKAIDKKIQTTGAIVKSLSEEDKQFKEEILQKMSSIENKLKNQKSPEKQSPYIGTAPTSSVCAILDEEFKIYIQVFFDLMDVTINSLKRYGTSEDSNLKKRLKQFSKSYLIAVITSLKSALLLVLKTFRNVLTLGTNFWSSPVAASKKFVVQFVVDSFCCLGALLFLVVNVSIISSILTFVTNFLGLTSISEYIKTWQDEITTFILDLTSDLFMLPLRSFWYLFINRNVFEEVGQNEYLTYLAKPILNLFIDVWKPIQENLQKKEPIPSIISFFQYLKGLIGFWGSKLVAGYEEALIFAEEMKKYAAEKAAAVLNGALKTLATGRKQVLALLGNVLNTNMNTKALGYQPNAFYDATAVCSLLQIPMMALKQHKNKETVSYALNNNMSKLEVLFVAYELAKDMEAKERLQQEDKALKF